MRPRSLEGLAAEIRDHIERETRDNIDRGMAPDEARRVACLAFGNVTAAQEDVRAVWIPVWLEQILQDIRHAVRSVTRNPVFSLIIVATLAIGVGLSTAVFSVFHSILLRPLDYPDPDRLVSLTITAPDLPPGEDVATNWEYWGLREQASSFDKVIAYTSYDQTLTARGEASRARVASVTDDFWSLTAVRPIVGRLPNPEERNVAVLSEHLFATVFSNDPQVVGQALTLGRGQVTIVGVVPRAFRFQFPVPRRPGLQPRDVEVFRTFAVTPAAPTSTFAELLSIVARLKPGVDLTVARAELATLHTRRFNPNNSNDVFAAANTTLRAAPLAERLVRDARVALNVLLAAVAFVLLVACANIADLFLARASVRQKEIAVRVSVGAGRARVLRQFLFESAMYSILAGAGAFLLARWGLSAIIRVYPQAVPRLAESTIDGSVIAVTLGVLTATTVIFGLVPALVLGRANVHDILKGGARTATPPRKPLRVRRLLAGAQLALAVALLTAAGLMMKSFWRMNTPPPGFEPEHILTLRVDFPADMTARAKVDQAERLLARLHSLPGVAAVSTNSHGDSITRLDVEGAPKAAPDAAAAPPIYMNQTSADFAKVMGLQLLTGRWFTADEPLPVVVLNETLAKRKFGLQDAIGRRVVGSSFGEPLDRAGPDTNPVPASATVVGVVSDLRYTKLDEDPTAEFYVPFTRTRSMYRLSLVVRAAGDPLALIPTIRGVFADMDTTQKPYDITTLDRVLSDSIAPRRFNLVVLVTFATTALLLALVGIYGVMSYSVSQRTHELGIRSALGAPRSEVIGMVVRQGMTVAGLGISVGVAGALLLTRVMTSLLYQVEPTDPQTFAMAAMLLALTALVACTGPALKAASVDPLVALRYE